MNISRRLLYILILREHTRARRGNAWLDISYETEEEGKEKNKSQEKEKKRPSGMKADISSSQAGQVCLSIVSLHVHLRLHYSILKIRTALCSAMHRRRENHMLNSARISYTSLGHVIRLEMTSFLSGEVEGFFCGAK